LDTASDKAFENIDCMSVILTCQVRITIMNQLNALSNCVEYCGARHISGSIGRFQTILRR
jgi:hypothetical protein